MLRCEVPFPTSHLQYILDLGGPGSLSCVETWDDEVRGPDPPVSCLLQ